MTVQLEMNLKTYLFVHDLSVKEFANKVDKEPSYISAIKNGTKTPGRKLAKKIKEVTNGEIDFAASKENAA